MEVFPTLFPFEVQLLLFEDFQTVIQAPFGIFLNQTIYIQFFFLLLKYVWSCYLIQWVHNLVCLRLSS